MKLPYMYVGVVTKNDDPEKLGRVKVRIPGLVDPESAWAFPMGAPGGGSKRHGFFSPPVVGAEVCVFFHGGDPDHPWFIGVQYHPELKSKPLAPHPLFSGFIRAAVKQSRLV